MNIAVAGEITNDTLKLFEKIEAPVTVRLNSYGGDVGAALAIYNRLKLLGEGAVEIEIEGIAASAATVIACAGKCKMAPNGLYMIHSPLLELSGNYNASDLEKNQGALQAIEKAIVAVYIEKTWLDEARLLEMMYAETWLTATDAKTMGFVDEITGEYAQAEDTPDAVKVNGVEVPLGRFKNQLALKTMVAAVKPAFAVAPKAEAMNAEGFFDKVKNLFIGKQQSARELALIKEVQSLRAELAKERARPKNYDELYNLIMDNLNSGAGAVRGSTSEAEDSRLTEVAKVVRYANGGVR